MKNVSSSGRVLAGLRSSQWPKWPGHKSPYVDCGMNLTTKHARASRVGKHEFKPIENHARSEWAILIPNVEYNLVLVFIFLALSLWARAWGQFTNQNACSMSQIWCAQFERLLHGARCLEIHKNQVRCLSLLSLPWVVGTIIYIKMGLRHPLDVSLGEPHIQPHLPHP